MAPKERRSSPHDPKFIVINDALFMRLAYKLDECSHDGLLCPLCPLLPQCIRFWDVHICYGTNGQSNRTMAMDRYTYLSKRLGLLLNAKPEVKETIAVTS